MKPKKEKASKPIVIIRTIKDKPWYGTGMPCPPIRGDGTWPTESEK